MNIYLIAKFTFESFDDRICLSSSVNDVHRDVDWSDVLSRRRHELKLIEINI